MKPAKLVSVERTPGQRKEYKAVFQKKDGKTYIRRFGTSSNFVTPGSGKTVEERKNYRARHSQNPKEKAALRKVDTPASLSMSILWGDSKSLKQNVKNYKKKHNL